MDTKHWSTDSGKWVNLYDLSKEELISELFAERMSYLQLEGYLKDEGANPPKRYGVE